MAARMPSYRKLPGRYRGWLESASLWIAADHLLSIKSDRFHEYYKRFYFRDIQALVITRCPRFRVSTRAFGVALVCIIAVAIASSRWPRLTPWLWLMPIPLAAAWAYLAVAQSCICRVYTAVSCEQLPSVYRRRTARRILAEVEPLIAQAQLDLPGNPIEETSEQPAAFSPAPSFLTNIAPQRRPTGLRRTLASDVFLASLLLYAAAGILEMKLLGARLDWMPHVFALVTMTSAIWVIVERYRGILRKSVQLVALASLILTGLYYYAQEVIRSMAAGFARTPADSISVQNYPWWIFVRQAHFALCVALVIAGAIVCFRSDAPEPL